MIFAVPCVVLAVWGYRLIHAVQPYLVVIMSGLFCRCFLTKSIVVALLARFVTRRSPARLAASEARPLAELSVLTDQLFFEALSEASHIKLWFSLLRC